MMFEKHASFSNPRKRVFYVKHVVVVRNTRILPIESLVNISLNSYIYRCIIYVFMFICIYQVYTISIYVYLYTYIYIYTHTLFFATRRRAPTSLKKESNVYLEEQLFQIEVTHF